ncbi:Crp/Fnr family transcriptional regulator [Bradyrhizobium sp. RDM12]
MTHHISAAVKDDELWGDAALKQESATRSMLLPIGTAPRHTRSIKNSILSGVSREDLSTLGKVSEPIVLRERMLLQDPKRDTEYVYFIESGLVSLRTVAVGAMFETAVIGHHGAVVTSRLMGRHASTHQAVVLFPGTAHRIRVEDLHRTTSDRVEVHQRLSRYIQALALHCDLAGLCGARHAPERRLANWLCLAADAVDANVLPVTHDYLSSVLGLRRAGVTETLIRFEEQRLIRKTRGVLHIGERKCLEQKACSCYKLISGAYAGLS